MPGTLKNPLALTVPVARPPGFHRSQPRVDLLLVNAHPVQRKQSNCEVIRFYLVTDSTSVC